MCVCTWTRACEYRRLLSRACTGPWRGTGTQVVGWCFEPCGTLSEGGRAGTAVRSGKEGGTWLFPNDPPYSQLLVPHFLRSRGVWELPRGPGSDPGSPRQGCHLEDTRTRGAPQAFLPRPSCPGEGPRKKVRREVEV